MLVPGAGAGLLGPVLVLPGAGACAGAVSWLCTWWRQVAGVGDGRQCWCWVPGTGAGAGHWCCELAVRGDRLLVLVLGVLVLVL